MNPDLAMTRSDFELVKTLAAAGRRPPVLIVAAPRAYHDGVASLLSEFAAPPVRACVLPGDLRLPPHDAGTFVLNDVAALTREQQAVVARWLDAASGAVQLVSITDAAGAERLRSSHFAEALFYRINTIRVGPNILAARVGDV
jgi:Sigma-54 interaction domain